MLPEPQPSNSPLIYLLPSARDIIFALLFWSLLAGALSNKLLADADIGWHIRIGEQILAAHAVPHSDPFSFTMRGQPWIDWEWLYDVALGIVHRSMGLNGVLWLGALLVSITMTLLIGHMLRNGTGLLLALALLLLTEMAAAIHLFARPHIVSWLLNLLWLIALERWEKGSFSPPSSSGAAANLRAGTIPRWLPWFFPLSILFWVNLHGAWVFGLALLACYGIAAAIESAREGNIFVRIRARQRARMMGWSFLCSAFATLVNPYGWRLHQHIYRYLSDRYLIDRIDEFRSPDFHGWAERAFAAILVLTILAFIGKRGKLRTSHLFIMLLAVYSGLYASRSLPVASIVLVVVIGPLLWESITAMSESSGTAPLLRRFCTQLVVFTGRMDAQELGLRGHLWPGLAVIASLAICLHGGRLGARRVVDAHFDSRHLPVEAAAFLAQEQNTNPVFAPDSWGGYLIYRLYSARQVIIDDRHDFYGRDRVRDYLVLTHAEPEWKQVLEKWQIRTIVFPRNSTLAGILGELPGEWKIVYEDKLAVVMEKRG
jgi:hypothetical protein